MIKNFLKENFIERHAILDPLIKSASGLWRKLAEAFAVTRLTGRVEAVPRTPAGLFFDMAGKVECLASAA